MFCSNRILKQRSGKGKHRTIKSIAEGKDIGNISINEDSVSVKEVRHTIE